MAFFAPRHAADVASALAWLDAQSPPDAAELQHAKTWSVLALPEPRMHPRAPALFAAAAGVPEDAIAAVLDGRAFIDDDGELRLWPWYPEEDASERPLAEAQAAALGLALPRECLDEPYEPAHYLARSGQAALEKWLSARGLDASSGLVDRIPIPPRSTYPDERFEGGMRATSGVFQAVRSAISTVRIYDYVGDAPEHRAELASRVDADLARLCARITGHDRAPPKKVVEPREVSAPSYPDTVVPVGRIGAVFAVRGGAILDADGALVMIDRAGTFVKAWRRPYGSIFAREDVLLADDFGFVLDLATGDYATGDYAVFVARMGLVDAPTTAGHDERTAPALSACGRYLLDVDESPFIVRLADGVTVAEGHTLERAITPPSKVGSGLVDPSAISVGTSTILDGVRFVVRSGDAPVRDGRSLAFALAGDRWRFLAGSIVRDGARVVARLGVPVSRGAFSADGSELWALSSDHAIHIAFDPHAHVVAIVPLGPILEEAARHA